MTMDQKMALATQWKAWTLVDEQRDNRPDEAFYAQYPHRDVPWAAFPDTAWQKDDTYLPQFLDQGLALVERAMEAILTEYGYGSDRDQRPFSERMAMLGQSEPQGKNRPTTGGYAVGNSYDGLVRRILHAIVTQDSFHLAMAGHSAAAGEYLCVRLHLARSLCTFLTLREPLLDVILHETMQATATTFNNRIHMRTVSLWNPYSLVSVSLPRREILALGDSELSKRAWPRQPSVGTTWTFSCGIPE